MSGYEIALDDQGKSETGSDQDEELIGVLMAISVVAKQLAKKAY